MEDDETVDIWLTEKGVLSNTSTCYIYAKTFKLLPHLLGRTVAGLNRTHTILPNIEMIIKPSEQELLQTRRNSSIHLKEIDEVIREVVGTKD